MLIHSFCISICIGWFAVKTFFISLRSDFRSNNNRNSYRLVHALHFNAYTLRLFMSLFFDSFFCGFFFSWFQYIFKNRSDNCIFKEKLCSDSYWLQCSLDSQQSAFESYRDVLTNTNLHEVCRVVFIALMHQRKYKNRRPTMASMMQIPCPIIFCIILHSLCRRFFIFSPDFLLFFVFLFSCINNMFYPFSLYISWTTKYHYV